MGFAVASVLEWVSGGNEVSAVAVGFDKLVGFEFVANLLWSYGYNSVRSVDGIGGIVLDSKFETFEKTAPSGINRIGLLLEIFI